MASIGQSIAGPRFHETDEVCYTNLLHLFFSDFFLSLKNISGLIDKRPTLIV
jgi:hypothetical protein